MASLIVDTFENGKIFDEKLAAQPDYLSYQQTVPQNTTAVGNRAGQKIGLVQGHMEVVVRVKTAVVITDTKVVTVKLQSSSDNAVSDAYADLATIYTVTAAGATTLAAGTELASYLYNPEDELWVRSSLTTNDTAVVGALDIFIRYLA